MIQTSTMPASTVGAERGERFGDVPGAIGGNPLITLADTFEGYIGRNDADMVRVALVGGATYEMAVVGVGEGPLRDPTLELRDASGQQLDYNDDFAAGVLEPGLLFTAPSTGDYYIRIAGSDRGTGGYEFRIREDGGDTREQATRLDRFDADVAFLHLGDIDWYEIALPNSAPMSYIAAGVGRLGVEGAILSLYDAEGTLLDRSQNIAGTTDALIDYAQSDAQTLYFSVEAPTTGFGAGQYLFGAVPDPRDDFSGVWSVREGAFAEIAIGPGDRDMIEIRLERGVEYGMELNSLGLFGLDDPVLELFDRDGTRLARNDDAHRNTTDAYLRYTVGESGLYYLRASAVEPDDVGLAMLHVEDLTNAAPAKALLWGDAEVTSRPIRVYFADRGETVNDSGRLYRSDGFSPEEEALTMEILDQVAAFTPLTFRVTERRDRADFEIALSDLDGGFTGQMNPQGTTIYSDGVAVLDNGRFWTPASLAKGGLMNHIIAHELGHGLGLAHPHDDGGNSSLMAGVREDDDFGDFGLNQVPYTVMTYNDYWNGGILGQPRDWGKGHLFGFGPLDIDVLQSVYGANPDHAGGDTVYDLSDRTWLETIWDTGGVDTILYTGRKDAVLDLTAATLDYSATGGGAVSYLEAGRAGFVIANGVEIESARSGAGNDRLTGNALDNLLVSRGGRDEVSGREGNDTLKGGTQGDLLRGQDGRDSVLGGAGNDTLYGGNGPDHVFGAQGRDHLEGGPGGDRLFGGAQSDLLDGGLGNDVLDGGGGVDVFRFDRNDGTDRILGFGPLERIDLSATGLRFRQIEIDHMGDSATIRFPGTLIYIEDLSADLGTDNFLF